MSGIPNECLVIIVSNSSRGPVDRFAMETEAVRQLGRFMEKRMIIVHQQDPGLAEVFKKVGYDSILDSQGGIRSGKDAGMILGMLAAKSYHNEAVGLI